MKFNDCSIYGKVVNFFEQAENVFPYDTALNLLFRRTVFYEEDDQWNYLNLNPDSYNSYCSGDLSHKLDLLPSAVSQTASITFDSCGFHTNCYGKIRLAGKHVLHDVFPHCDPCLHCQDSLSYTCPPTTCLPPGQPPPGLPLDDRFIRATDCYLKNTGRWRCGNVTELISVDRTTVVNFRLDVPSTVRGQINASDRYGTFFGMASWAANDSLPAGYYSDVDTTYTDYGDEFPPCQPMYHWPDSIEHWSACQPAHVLVPNCAGDANCYADLTIHPGTLSSNLASSISGTVSIEGQFIVDTDFAFQNAQLMMNPGAEIVVQPSVTLLIENSTVSSCRGVMWKSITVQHDGVLKIRQSYINEGEDAVRALEGSSIVIDGNQFRNNRVAVQVPNQSTAPVYAVSLYAVNNTFYSAGTMPAPYPGQLTAVGAQGYAAFDIDRITLDLTAAPNLIHSLSNGIVALQCDLTITQATFLHIQPDSAYEHYANGSAIYARGPKSWRTLKQTGFGTEATAAPSFDDCHWGIYTEYMNVYSMDNFMNDVGTAYRVDRSGYKEVEIHDNRLDTRRDGIVLVMNDGAAHVLVEHNDITFARNLPPGQYTKGYYGIRVNEANTLNPDSRIQNNSIRYRQGASTAYGGIGLVSARAYLVANNGLHMTDNSSNRVGVHLSGCKEPKVICNDIHGATNGYPELGQASVRSFGGTAPLISCNRMDRTTNGMLFSGWTAAEVRGNEFNNHKCSLHLEQNAVIGPQDHRGNLWLQPAQVWGAWCETQAGAVQSVITYDPGQPSNVPSSYLPPTWFDPQAGPTFDCYEGIGECVGYKERCAGCANEIYRAVADSSLENGAYTDETRWSLKGDLYEFLKADSTMLEDPVMQAFYSAVQSTVIAALKEVDEDRIALFDIDSTIVLQLQQNREQLIVLQGELKLALVDLSAPDLTEAQKSFQLGAIQGLQQSIGELIAFNTQAMALAADSRVLSAEEVKNTNTMLGVTELTESNSKTVYEIYLSTVAKDVEEFTTQQTQDLFSVANQCPLLGGDAVFTARALYYLIDPEQEFDDPALCLQEGLVTKSLKEEPKKGCSIVPNPAGSAATLVLSSPLDDGGQLLIYGATGVELIRMRLPSDQVRVDIDLGGLAVGVYHFQVRSAVGEVGDGRLIIVH
ncbi:MAG: hypothetical protein H6591_10755 [Flavobacteriales bacterium]|nr:hypothetical protein [Flavobacteriales bacterium]